MAMAGEGATADEVTALLRDLMQGYFDRCAERERGAPGTARLGVASEAATY